MCLKFSSGKFQTTEVGVPLFVLVLLYMYWTKEVIKLYNDSIQREASYTISYKRFFFLYNVF